MKILAVSLKFSFRVEQRFCVLYMLQWGLVESQVFWFGESHLYFDNLWIRLYQPSICGLEDRGKYPLTVYLV